MADTADPVLVTLSETLRRQQGVLARRQARAGGMSDQMLRHRLRPGGPWQKLLPGVYLTVTGTPTSDQKEMAAQLYAGAGSVITGITALRRQGVRVPGSSVIDVLIAAHLKRASAGFVRVRRTTRMPDPVAVIGARHYALPSRAVADAARAAASLQEARALVSSAVQARRCPLELLTEELARGPARGSRPLRDALIEVAEGIRSSAESDLRGLITRAELPVPLYNPSLYSELGELIAIPDAWWPDAGVVAEADSREWHLSPEDWQQTNARHARMTAYGMLVLHFTPQQIRTQPDQIAATIRGAIAAGRSRPRLPIRTRPATG